MRRWIESVLWRFGIRRSPSRELFGGVTGQEMGAIAQQAFDVRVRELNQDEP